ncbi:molybdopterin biosynthesis protein [[Eubacterium] cellulosolvens]
MPRKIFHVLQTLEEARRRIESTYKIQPVGIERIPLIKALGYVLAQDCLAQVDVPGFDRSQMDGYAVLAHDTYGSSEDDPKTLKIVGRIEAGVTSRFKVREGTAVEVATGAPLPSGANAVVIIEYTEEKDSVLYVFKAVTPGMNVMPAGSDISTGEVILKKGTPLRHREIGILAAIGLKQVPVYCRPKVSIISTGNELQDVGEYLEYGKVYDVNTYILFAALKDIGCDPIPLGIVSDQREEIRAQLIHALKSSDVVLTSGSTSAGFGDMIFQIFNEIDPNGQLVHGLALKPGKPTMIAVLQGKLVFGLPGYPTSAITIFDQLVKPILLQMLGRKNDSEEGVVEAEIAFRTYSEKGRRELLPIYLIGEEEGGYTAYPILKGSGAVTTFAMADGYINIPDEIEFLEEGEKVHVHLYSDKIRPANLIFIGSHCAGVDLLLTLLAEILSPLRPKIVNVGSITGLRSAAKGEADFAGIHLLDDSGEYNIPFIKTMKLADNVHLIRGYEREQGFIYVKNRPPITRIEEIIKQKLSFINRNHGSGTRLLIDTLIKKYADTAGLDIDSIKSRIIHYNVEAKTHSAVASAVRYGRADVGVAIRPYAEKYDLAFSPISNEKYDFAIPRNRVNKPIIQQLIRVLQSTRFKQRLEIEVPGIHTTPDSGKIIL